MFEHADRHDPVEAPVDVAIIDQLELDLVGHALAPGPLARDLDAAPPTASPRAPRPRRRGGGRSPVPPQPQPMSSTRCPGLAGRAWRRYAPACSRCASSRLLRGIGEIGAAILQATDRGTGRRAGRRVIMMRDVLPRLRRLVAAEQRLQRAQSALAHRRLAARAAFLQRVGSRRSIPIRSSIVPVLDHQPTVHVELAQRQPRVAHQSQQRGAVGDADRHDVAPARARASRGCHRAGRDAHDPF